MVARLLSNAFSYVQVGNYKKASELWEQIVSLDALNPFAHTGLAGVAHQNKKHGPAASHYKRALAGLDAGAIIGPAADEGSGGGGGGQAGGFHPGDPHLGQSLGMSLSLPPPPPPLCLASLCLASADRVA